MDHRASLDTAAVRKSFLNPYSVDVRPACGPIVMPTNLSGCSVSFTVRIRNKPGILIIKIELN